MAIGESAGILFKIKGDSSDAVRAFKQTEAAQSDLTGATAGLTSSFSSLAGPALLAGAAITVVATAAIAGVRALFDLTKSTAEFGSTIFDASQKTGLGAERLSAMKFAADQSGTSLDAVTAATARFSKVVIDAANGSEKAQVKLDRLGVSSTDLDTALKQALATIVKLPAGTQQMALAMDAFGKSGADLLPFIKSFDGDLDKLTARAKELGVTITDEAAAAADEFGDQLDLLNAQIEGVGRTIGFAFMPIFMSMAKSLSDFLTQNQALFQQWGTNASDIIRGVMVTMQALESTSQSVTNNSVTHWIGWANRMLIALNPVAEGMLRILNLMRQVGSDSRGPGAFMSGAISPALGMPSGGGGKGGGGGGAPKKDKSAEQLAARDLAAQIKIETGNLKVVQEDLSAAFKKIKEDLLGSDVKTVQAALLEFTKKWVFDLLKAVDLISELETKQLKSDATENERTALRQAQDERRRKIDLKFTEDIKAAEDKLWETRLERGKTEAEMAQHLFDIEQDRIEQYKTFLESLGEGGLGENLALTALKPSADSLGDPDETLNPFEHFLTGWQLMYDTIMSDAPTLQDTLESLGGIVGRAFDGMANAIGHMVQQWVLYGTTAPAIMRKILASALATIAAEAAVRAIYELAMGFASLAVQDYEGAAFHFGSAALFGTIAAVAAIAGRVVAGNAFKQQTATATGGASGNQRSSSSEGGAYSSLPDQTYETGIHSPGIQGQINVKIGLDSDGVLTLLEQNARNNGRFRGLVLRLADGA